MILPTRDSANPRVGVPAGTDVDEMLTHFFRAALPHPWPVCPRPGSEKKTMPPPQKFDILRFLRMPTRIGVAAGVAALLAGYIALQGWFPEYKAPLASPDL